MHFDGSLGRAKTRPRKDAQAEVEDRGIECIDRLFQFDSKTVSRLELARDFDLTERKILIDMPVARFVGVSESTPGDVASNAQMVEFGLVSAQTGFDVAKTLAVRQLCEGQAEKLIEMRKLVTFIYAVMIALQQTNLRRLPAYASISHVGLVVVGLASLNMQGIQGAIFQLLDFSLIAGCLMLIAGFIQHRLNSTEVIHLGGLAKVMLRLTSFFFLFALANWAYREQADFRQNCC